MFNELHCELVYDNKTKIFKNYHQQMIFINNMNTYDVIL